MPMGKEQCMEPPWQRFEYAQFSLGWGMGGGEYYLKKWHEWFRQLNSEEQDSYISQNPEPEGWFEFYSLHLASNHNEYREIFKRTIQLKKVYCEHHYDLAIHHERGGNYEHALVHLENALICNHGRRVWDDTDALIRYSGLKRHLANEMALKPKTKASWEALRQSEDRVKLEIELTLSPEEYEFIQKGTFFPSDMGRTWTKYLENDMLYIHRHWRELCLFLVNFQRQEDLSYHIAEAWMNPNSAIPLPLMKPPTEPPLLLRLLIDWFLRMQKQYQLAVSGNHKPYPKQSQQ